MNFKDTLSQTGSSAAKIFGRLMCLAVAAAGLSMVHIPKAEAARCSADSVGNWNCARQERNNGYWCGIVPWSRKVRWQVPEGTAPAGGWRTAFYYQGTTPTGTNSFSGPIVSPLNVFGMWYLPQTFHELLDDPTGTGKKYAVFAPEPPNSTVLVQFWHTNVVVPYAASCDYSFLNDFFAEIKNGSYGSASQYDMNRRYAYGISSGGYNSSRMAVTFNGSSVWKALGIISASYATCSGPLCVVPPVPSNHPPTKFWHGLTDAIVPILTMELYYSRLISQGIPTAKVVHPFGHQLTSDNLGSGGVKAWFDAH
ncbi:hypothetical protein BH11PSE11_BH11PSE11_14310 [soil metagenome]